jgi:hypothetical protein
MDTFGPLPGVALGSPLILAVERTMALFTAWMVVVIVVVRAIAGDLPTELSGQGFKYASRETAEKSTNDIRDAVGDLERELEGLRQAVYDIDLNRND